MKIYKRHLLPTFLIILFIISFIIPRQEDDSSSLPPGYINLITQEEINKRYLVPSILTFGLLDAGETARASGGMKILVRVFQLLVIGGAIMYGKRKKKRKETSSD